MTGTDAATAISYDWEEVRAGGVMVLPPHVPHGITAVERSVVFDLFSPPSEKTGLDQA